MSEIADLRSWATVRQLEFIEAIERHGGIRPAARALGIDHSAIAHGIAALRAKAALAGHSPAHHMRHTVPDPFLVKGVSTYFDKDGKPAGQWVKSRLDDQRVEAARKAALDAATAALPRLEPTRAPPQTQARLCNVYTMTDCHVGMLAWHREGGADWDISIAERVLAGCFEHMVNAAPAARVGVVAQIGDFLHSDGLLPLTPTAGNVLDQDGRFSKIVQTAVRLLRRLVDFALLRHERVVVLMGEGNHDLASSVWLRAMFRALYENEPRCQVIDSELPYYAYQHGQVMLAWHHGHLKKNEALPLMLATQFAAMWGSTTKRYCHTGHRHFAHERDFGGMTVVQHPTLAARDAYASRHGWHADRQATAITYHDEFGQVARNTVTPEMLS